jgi:hypothetical protein
MKRPRIDPIHLSSITEIGTMMRVVVKMIKSGLIEVNEDPVVQDVSNLGAALQIGLVLVKQTSKIWHAVIIVAGVGNHRETKFSLLWVESWNVLYILVF